MQIPLSIRDQWGEATPLLLFLSLSLSLSLPLSPPPPPLLSVLLLPLSLATNVRCVNRRVQCVYVCACVVSGVLFFKTAKRTHSHWVLLHLISARSLLQAGSGCGVCGFVCVLMHLFGLTLSASEPCVGVTLPSRPCLPDVDPPHSPTLKVTLLNTISSF